MFMDERELKNFYIKQTKATKYALDFFERLIRERDQRSKIVSSILPITYYNEIEELVNTVKNDMETMNFGGFIHSEGKQALIRIGIGCDSDRLTAKIKRIIRHEVIHYFLFLLDLPCSDDDLMFWCYCYIYDGDAYKPLTEDNHAVYDLFVKYYKEFTDCKNQMSDVLINSLLTHIANANGELSLNSLTEQIEKDKNVVRVLLDN